MNDQNHHLETLRDIKQIMEKSSRFISLSGLSGISAGICALIGAWFALNVINNDSSSMTAVRKSGDYLRSDDDSISLMDYMGNPLLHIAILTFLAAFALAFLFTYLRSRKSNTPVWGTTARRLMMNVSIPMIAGGIYLLKLMQAGAYGYIAPGCLIFYGLALMNASKYTLTEIRYLGFGMIILGIINLFNTGHGIYFWAAGFGVLHIIYGVYMWWKYERSSQ